MNNIIGISGKKQSGKDEVCNIIGYLTSTMSAGGRRPYDTTQKYVAPYTPWKKKQFAGKLKQIVALLIGCKVSDLEDEEFKSKPLGEEWTRWYYRHTWGMGELGKISKFYASKEDADSDFHSVKERFPTGSELVSQQLTPRVLLQQIGTQGLRDLIHPDVHVNALFGEYNYTTYSITTRKDGQLISEEKITAPKWIIPDTRFPNEAKRILKHDGIILRIENPRIIPTADQHESETALDDWNFNYIIVNDSSIEDLVEKVVAFCISFNLL
jgi:hypothetical protein